MQRNALADQQSGTSAGKPGKGAPMSAGAIAERLDRLGTLPLNEALTRLMLELTRVREARLDAAERVELMHLVKRPVLTAIASLPKPTPASHPVPRGARGMTLEQHLMQLMIENLRQALHDYDRAQGSRLVDDHGQRTWLLQQVFRFFARQLRYAVDWNRPWPVGVWRDLHDVFVYLVGLGSVALHSGFAVAAFDDELDAAIEYKRLLLLGLVDRHTDRLTTTKAYFHLLKHWSADSMLLAPEKALGKQDVIRVQVNHDGPPQLVRGVLDASFRGWVLHPADACVGYLAQSRRSGSRRPVEATTDPRALAATTARASTPKAG
jgi:hypothetical protein